MKQKILLFELNEVPLRIIDEFCARRPGSCLARLLPRCRQYETFAADQGHLSPWITWPSVHRGVANERHGIHSFGQDLTEVDREFPPLWRLLAEGGVRTGVFGSLHSYSGDLGDERFAFYVPDTFAAGSECFPQRLAAFQEFNLSMVQDSPRNVASRIRWQPALNMLLHAPALGLKPQTLLDVGLQLCSERLRAERRVRRRTYQALLAFDVFFQQFRATQPDFATFFTNHVASALHRYWAASFPEDYAEFGFDAGWVATYRNEIDFALRKLDGCLARLVALVERQPEYALWIATSMGQAATTAQPLQTQLFITDLPRFMAALGVPAGGWSQRPAMAPDTNVVIEQPYLADFAQALERLSIDGAAVEWQRGAGGFFSVRLGQSNVHARPAAVCFDGRPMQFEQLGMAAVRIEDGSGTTAYHIPQGALLIYDPRRPVKSAARTQISTLDIAPSLLREFRVPIPSYMTPPKLTAA